MEHKSPLPDIEFNPSPRPFETKESVDIHATHMDTSQIKPLTDIISVPQHKQEHEPQHQEQSHTEHDHLVAHKTFENMKYTTYETATGSEPNNIISENLHQETVAINSEAMPNTKYGSVSDRVKTIEKCANDEPISNPYKTVPIWNAASESPVMQFSFDKQCQRAVSITPTHQNGTCTPNPLNDTIDQFSSKIQEYEQSHWTKDYELKAPALVRHVTPVMKPFENGVQSKDDGAIHVPINLEPGEPPELCFAPRVSCERRQSLVEKIEKSLERDLERGPSKVLPHSVRMMPPSPQTVSTETYESSQRIIKQSKQQHDINQPNKDINHIKNIFYEHNKPLHRNTVDNVPSPTKAPEKVRIWSVSVCAICRCAEMSLNPK